jgi:hypothetical protein
VGSEVGKERERKRKGSKERERERGRERGDGMKVRREREGGKEGDTGSRQRDKRNAKGKRELYYIPPARFGRLLPVISFPSVLSLSCALIKQFTTLGSSESISVLSTYVETVHGAVGIS